MIDLLSVRSVTLDIAETYESREAQDQTAELIWRLLERNYQIYLYSSNQNHDLRREDFHHPALTFLTLALPLSEEALAKHKELVSPRNLWVTDDPEGLRWLRQRGLPYATRWEEADESQQQGLRISSLSDLAEALNPNKAVFREVARMLREIRERKGNGALVVGIGGPPLSGYDEFAVELKRHLESAGFALVELLDISVFVSGTERADTADTSTGTLWKDRAAGRWLLDQLLDPSRRGESVYVESLPEGVPREFAPQLPLFLHGESVVLAFAEMPFSPPLAERFDCRILLEVSPWETTRRIYEMDEGDFERKFTDQYLEHEGRAYRSYLETHGVREQASLRVDANHPQALAVIR